MEIPNNIFKKNPTNPGKMSKHNPKKNNPKKKKPNKNSKTPKNNPKKNHKNSRVLR